jgi:uncharacterized protein YbjT (DUF2867 family)
MILITGGSGTIGQALLAELRTGHIAVRVLTRDVERARAKLGSDIELARADFADPRSLEQALHGVQAVFMVWAPGPFIADHDLAMVRAMKDSAVGRIVKLSSFGADRAPPLLVSSWHRRGEVVVMRSGLAWTILRPAGFASNTLGWAPNIRAGAAVPLSTGDGQQAIVDPRDIAAVARRALTTTEHTGQAYTLTGPALLSAPEQVATLGRALGRTIAIEEVTPDVAAERMRSRRLPEELIAAAREGSAALRAGVAAERSDDVARILGRPPRSFAAWVDDHIDQFR